MLLKGLQDSRELVNMIINDGNEVVVTAILDVDDENNTITLDCASTDAINQRLIEAPRVYFEASLNRISIQFSSSSMSRQDYMNTPALSCTIPTSLIRLQRREFYRINTPISQPVICIMQVPEENGGGIAKMPLVDISCGGIALLDEKKVLDAEFGDVNFRNGIFTEHVVEGVDQFRTDQIARAGFFQIGERLHGQNTHRRVAQLRVVLGHFCLERFAAVANDRDAGEQIT